jgi:hypothetical protein
MAYLFRSRLMRARRRITPAKRTSLGDWGVPSSNFGAPTNAKVLKSNEKFPPRRSAQPVTSPRLVTPQ